MTTTKQVQFDTMAFVKKFGAGIKDAMKGLQVFKTQTLEAYAKMDTEFLQALMRKPKAPKPPKTHACHRTMSDRKAAGSKRRKAPHFYSLRRKRRMGLWNV